MGTSRLRVQILAALGVVPLAFGCQGGTEGPEEGCAQAELCNGLDDDCDGEVDEDFQVVSTIYRDADGDGFPAQDGESTLACDGEYVEGYAHGSVWDCNDQDPDAWPDAPESCDQADQDCDGAVDEGWAYADQDGDGYAGTFVDWSVCDELGEGMDRTRSDCDDASAAVNPGADEVCGDGVDTDCDGRLSCVETTYTEEETTCVEPWEIRYMESYRGDACAGCDFTVDMVELESASHWREQACREAFATEASFVFAGDTLSILNSDGDPVLSNLPGTWKDGVYQSSGENWKVDVDLNEIAGSPDSEGRPFHVDGVARLAETGQTPWGRTLSLSAEPSVEVREQAAVVWRQAGFAEHASIASFARFSLELMALGAPAPLLLEASVAMADEIRHAELCFGLARALGSEAEVGALDVKDSLSAAGDPAETLRALLIEGCVGETLAAARADLALQTATEPSVREALAEIAQDEARHAAYAWRCARWILERHPELRELAAQTLERERARSLARSGAPHPAREALAALGVLDDRARLESARVTWAEVIEPARALLVGPANQPRVRS